MNGTLTEPAPLAGPPASRAAAAHALTVPAPARGAVPPAPRVLMQDKPVVGWKARLKRRFADFWLDYFFWHATYVPWYARGTKWFYLGGAWVFSRSIRLGTQLNAKHLLGPGSTPRQRSRLGRRMLGSHYDFILDVCRSTRRTLADLQGFIDTTEGLEHYQAARAARRGAIIVTAHMGNFEVGTAALRRHEAKVHVVFRRDAKARFERVRSKLHQALGVLEAPLDEGWGIWVRLRDALRNDEVVLLQGDRVLPGQKGERVPFFDGHTVLPTGPIKLALASGAPIIPIFCLRLGGGRVRMYIDEPIWVGDAPAAGLGGGAATGAGPHPALLQLAGVIERYVRRFPEQWLMMEPAWCEDAARWETQSVSRRPVDEAPGLPTTLAAAPDALNRVEPRRSA